MFMIRLKHYSCHNVFNKKNINTFDVLTFIQLRTVLTDEKFTKMKMTIHKTIKFLTCPKTAK